MPLARSTALAQSLSEQMHGPPTAAGKGSVDDYLFTGPVAAGTYRVDIAGRGGYTLAVYTRKP